MASPPVELPFPYQRRKPEISLHLHQTHRAVAHLQWYYLTQSYDGEIINKDSKEKKLNLKQVPCSKLCIGFVSCSFRFLSSLSSFLPFFFLFYLNFIENILLSDNTPWPQFPIPPLLDAPQLFTFLPDPLSLHILFREEQISKRQGPNQGEKRYNKTRQKPSYEWWTRQHNRRKIGPRAEKMIIDTLSPTVRSPKQTPGRQTPWFTFHIADNS